MSPGCLVLKFYIFPLALHCWWRPAALRQTPSDTHFPPGTCPTYNTFR